MMEPAEPNHAVNVVSVMTTIGKEWYWCIVIFIENVQKCKKQSEAFMGRIFISNGPLGCHPHPIKCWNPEMQNIWFNTLWGTGATPRAGPLEKILPVTEPVPDMYKVNKISLGTFI